jgi:hypothetical protein
MPADVNEAELVGSQPRRKRTKGPASHNQPSQAEHTPSASNAKPSKERTKHRNAPCWICGQSPGTRSWQSECPGTSIARSEAAQQPGQHREIRPWVGWSRRKRLRIQRPVDSWSPATRGKGLRV